MIQKIRTLLHDTKERWADYRHHAHRAYSVRRSERRHHDYRNEALIKAWKNGIGFYF